MGITRPVSCQIMHGYALSLLVVYKAHTLLTLKEFVLGEFTSSLKQNVFFSFRTQGEPVPVYCQFQKSLIFFSKGGGEYGRSLEQERWFGGLLVPRRWWIAARGPQVSSFQNVRCVLSHSREDQEQAGFSMSIMSANIFWITNDNEFSPVCWWDKRKQKSSL